MGGGRKRGGGEGEDDEGAVSSISHRFCVKGFL